MEGRLFEDLVVSRGGGGRVGAAGLPLSFVVHAAGLAGLLALSMAVPEDLPAPRGVAIADVVFATGPRPPARSGPRPSVSRPPRPAPRGSAVVLEALETPEIAPEPFAPDDGESDAACIGCALADDGSFGGGGGIDDGTLGLGDGPGASAPGTAPLRVGGHIQAPRKIRHVDPVYPDLARRAGVSGIVILECEIDRGGRVQTVRVASGHPLLNDAAVGAVRQWSYQPTLLNGVPVAVVMTVTVRFTSR
jgi:protein TonB